MNDFSALAQEYIKQASALRAMVEEMKSQRRGLSNTQMMNNVKKVSMYEGMIYDLEHNAQWMEEYYED